MRNQRRDESVILLGRNSELAALRQRFGSSGQALVEQKNVDGLAFSASGPLEDSLSLWRQSHLKSALLSIGSSNVHAFLVGNGRNTFVVWTREA
jgi:hypothetical protein